MPSQSLAVSNLSYTAPDGRKLFHNLDLAFAPLRTGLIGRNGVGKTTLLRLLSGELPMQSGRRTVAGRLGVLQQTVGIDARLTIADLFGVRHLLAVVHRCAGGVATPEELAEADWSVEPRLQTALTRTGLDAAPETPLATLSGGQQTRARLAALLFAEPDFLLLDEPTNNLDRDGRAAVIELLRSWRAGAIVVSHDRELLDQVDEIVELTALGAGRYGGNWTAYRQMKSLELAAAEKDLLDAEKHAEQVARRAQLATERKARKDGAGKRKAKEGGIPRILLGKRRDQSEATSGASARRADHDRDQAADAVAASRARLERLLPTKLEIPPTGLPSDKRVLRLDRVSAGYDAARPILRDFSFDVVGPERVAIVGPNGSGKTTLLSVVIGRLAPCEGEVRVHTPFAFLDQQVSLLDRARSLRDNFRRLNPGADETFIRTALARFRFRDDAALQPVSALSGGQVLRAALACVLGAPSPPPLLILDEPTNHLDLDALEAVEAGLRGYDGALLVVSHDQTFLQSVEANRTLSLPGAAAGA